MRKQDAFCRGVAGFLGTLLSVNAVAGVVDARLDASVWWIDLRALPHALQVAVGVSGAIALITVAVRPSLRPWMQSVMVGVLAVFALLALRDAVRFYALLGRGTIRAWLPVPLSLPLSILFLWIGWRGRAMSSEAPSRHHDRRERWTAVATAAVATTVTPLLWMLFFGTTDYRRPADLAVVFGARAYANGRPSDALADRVRTACDLYRQGLVTKLLFSGGPGDGSINEAEAMRRFARNSGVPDSAIILDNDGVNTRATVRNALPVARSLGRSRVIAVSHGYHLPRVKMCFQREGVEVYTVPATQTRTLRAMPRLIAREVAAAWAYYLGSFVR